jgi:hypothetical protein
MVLRGQGVCSICADYRFNPAEPAIVYLVTHPILTAHKVGISNIHARQNRLKHWLLNGWQTFKTLHFDVGADAQQVEKAVLIWLRDDLELGPCLTKKECGHGWSETVSADSIDLPTIWDQVVNETTKLRERQKAQQDGCKDRPAIRRHDGQPPDPF